MAHTPEVLDWFRRLGIRSVINAPCENTGDCKAFSETGIRVLCLNINPIQNVVQGDLVSWRPDTAFDAAYVNCFFCTTNLSKVGTHADAARNIASWPIRYIVMFDTIGEDWEPPFREMGWVRLSDTRAEGNHDTHTQVWERAAK